MNHSRALLFAAQEAREEARQRKLTQPPVNVTRNAIDAVIDRLRADGIRPRDHSALGPMPEEFEARRQWLAALFRDDGIEIPCPLVDSMPPKVEAE